MKKVLMVAVIAIVSAFLIGSALVSAQRVGGYKEIANDDEGAVAAAEFAVKDQSEKKEMTYKLVSIEKAETQVVAGINYRLCLKVGYKQNEEDATEFVRVVVNRNLQKEFSLTSWTPESCGDNDP
jgi:ABC-type Na+ efflux pump permease subunit